MAHQKCAETKHTKSTCNPSTKPVYTLDGMSQKHGIEYVQA